MGLYVYILLILTLITIAITWVRYNPSNAYNQLHVKKPTKVANKVDIKDNVATEEVIDTIQLHKCGNGLTPPCSRDKEARTTNGVSCCFSKKYDVDEQTQEMADKLAIELGVNVSTVIGPLKEVLSKIMPKNAAYTRMIGQRIATRLNSILKGTANPKVLGLLRNILSRLGIKVGTFVANGTMKSAVAVATKTATTIGRLAKAASSGVLIAFELVSLALDIIDPRGFNTMRTKSFYVSLKKYNDITLNQQITNSGGSMVIGPLDFISTKELNKSISSAISIALTKIIQDVTRDAIINDLEDEDIEEYIEAKLSSVNEDSLYKDVMQKLCTDSGGKLLPDGTCTFKVYDCESYTWPIPDNADASNMFVRRFVNGSCILEDPSVRMLCDEDNLIYDRKSGICDITPSYCESKGADWSYDDLIGQNDCKVSYLQVGLESLFGKTIVRSIKTA